MRSSADPTIHRQRETQILEHVQRLLKDDRLVLDTTSGRRSVTRLIQNVTINDGALELKRLMSELNRPDRELEAAMPRQQSLVAMLSQTRWFVFKKTVGRLVVSIVAPSRALLCGQTPRPLGADEVRKALAAIPPAPQGVPSTIVLVSTSGFDPTAIALAERTVDRVVILLEPNDAGGWSTHGPSEVRSDADLFDPEAEAAKRQRVLDAIEARRTDLLTGSLSADRLAQVTQLPLQLVESAVKSYARDNTALTARRIDGRLVLFRESSQAAKAEGMSMPMIDRIKALFSRKGDSEKQIAFLSERRAALGEQRDRAYEEIEALGAKDEQLQRQFRESSSPVVKRRVTSQLLALRKDMERRQQMIRMLDQQLNIVSTHLHNLELVRQGSAAKLPDSEQIAADATAAEETLATLQADAELAESAGGIAHVGLTDEEQALYAELERENAQETTPAINLDHADPEPPPQAQKAAAPRQQRREAEPG